MTIVAATLLRQINFPGTENITLYRFSVPNIPVATLSDDIEFLTHSPGKIETLRINCSSKNYQLSLRLEPGVVSPSIEEFYNVIAISQAYYDDNADIWYAKPPGPNQHKLYGLIRNVDAVNATGVIYIELVIIRY